MLFRVSARRGVTRGCSGWPGRHACPIRRFACGRRARPRASGGAAVRAGPGDLPALRPPAVAGVLHAANTVPDGGARRAVMWVLRRQTSARNAVIAGVISPLPGSMVWVLRTVAARAGVDRETARRYVRGVAQRRPSRGAGQSALCDELTGVVIAAVSPARPNGHGAARGGLAWPILRIWCCIGGPYLVSSRVP